MSKQASSLQQKGKAKSDGGPMELVDNDVFLVKLSQLFESTRDKGTVWLTQKRYTYDPEGDAIMKVEEEDDREYPCLLRATNGHIKFETKILPSELPKFHSAYGALLKSHMSTLRKRDKKREKHKAEQIALKKKKLLETVVVSGPKRGNGRRMRQRRVKAALKQDEARRVAAKREEEKAKVEER